MPKKGLAYNPTPKVLAVPADWPPLGSYSKPLMAMRSKAHRSRMTLAKAKR